MEKLFPCLIRSKRHAMETCGAVEVQLHAFAAESPAGGIRLSSQQPESEEHD
jgi:hypothetical protein